jgi:hypothetical protein
MRSHSQDVQTTGEESLVQDPRTVYLSLTDVLDYVNYFYHSSSGGLLELLLYSNLY